MELRSAESVTVDILGSIQQFVCGVVVLVFKYLAISAALAVAPAVFVTLPLYLLWQDPDGDCGWLGVVVFFAAPWSCAFYMGLFASWGWRKTHGDYYHAVGKSFLYAFGGLVVSYLLEGLYICVGLRFFPVLGSALAHAVGFESLLVTAFLPVILLLIKRWKIGRNERSAMQEEALR